MHSDRSTPSALREALTCTAAARRFVDRLQYYDTVDSTNNVASNLVATSGEDGWVVVADHQTAGRGRRGRSWFSPAGAGLYVSVALRAPNREGLSLVTLAAGVGIAQALRQATGLHVELKWPNDLVVPSGQAAGWRKLGGILTETSSAGSTPSIVIVGFGVNLRTSAYPADLGDRVTSVEQESGTGSEDRWMLLARCLAGLAQVHADLCAGEADGILSRWRALAPSSRGSRVRWMQQGNTFEGLTDGVDDTGALLIRVDGQPVVRFVAGELEWRTDT